MFNIVINRVVMFTWPNRSNLTLSVVKPLKWNGISNAPVAQTRQRPALPKSALTLLLMGTVHPELPDEAPARKKHKPPQTGTRLVKPCL